VDVRLLLYVEGLKELSTWLCHITRLQWHWNKFWSINSYLFIVVYLIEIRILNALLIYLNFLILSKLSGPFCTMNSWMQPTLPRLTGVNMSAMGLPLGLGRLLLSPLRMASQQSSLSLQRAVPLIWPPQQKGLTTRDLWCFLHHPKVSCQSGADPGLNESPSTDKQQTSPLGMEQY
jgi:hypothetical protein